MPAKVFDEDKFEYGHAFDGSSIAGWKGIQASDMLLIPDPARYWIDPFMERPTLCMVADVVDPITREGYWLDPRRALFCRQETFPLRSSLFILPPWQGNAASA